MKELHSIADAVQSAERLTEAVVKKAWMIMDAASEKRAPTEYLSPQAVKRIQGQKTEG